MAESKDTPLAWHMPDAQPFRLTGFAWYDTDKVYRRLPLNPSHKLPEAVDGLANNTAGGQIAFCSNTNKVSVRVELAGAADQDHMPPTGQCGFDLYVGEPGQQRFLTVSRFNRLRSEYESVLFEHHEAHMRCFTINFPLYQGVKKVEVGLTPSARVEPPPPYDAEGRIVFYGTSIVQGGCAPRPGLAHTNILSRMLNSEVVNLGFSGSANGEPEVAHVVSQVTSPRMYVLDYEANQGDYDKLNETLQEFIRILRESHREVPILVISRTPYAKDHAFKDLLDMRLKNAALQKGIVERAREEGDENIYFFDGSTLFGETDVDECTVDGIHPNGIGFIRMARALEPTFRNVL